MALGTAILAVSFVIAGLAEILRHRGLSAAQRPAPADPSTAKETSRGELQWHST
jgi:spermidine/putrescine transport system permease protein